MPIDSSTLLQTLQNDLQQRLEKLWRVFSWCSGILITITGGVIYASRANTIRLLPADRILITLVILVVAGYGWLWIHENLQLETRTRNRIRELYEAELQERFFSSHRPDFAKFGYKTALLCLGAVATGAAWIDCIFN